MKLLHIDAGITFIRAEGLALGPENRNAAIDAAVADVAKLAA